MHTLQVVPVPGRRVFHPGTGQPLTKPEQVLASAYWFRRLADGDVTQGKTQGRPPKKATKGAKSAKGVKVTGLPKG